MKEINSNEELKWKRDCPSCGEELIYGILREKDIRRQNEIEQYLKCKFIRIPIKYKV